jgi:hypothetical protein
MDNKIKKNITAAAKMAGILFVLGFGFHTSKYAPDHALVYVTPETNFFYPAIPEYAEFMKQNEYDYKAITLKEAHKYNKIIDRDAKERGYFFQEGRSVSGLLLEYIGLLPKQKSRWDEDGNWIF